MPKPSLQDHITEYYSSHPMIPNADPTWFTSLQSDALMNYNWSFWNDDPISQLAHPGMVQMAEFYQQVMLQMYQNQWNSEEARMRRGIAAGINPYLMANGIAGGSFPTASAPNSAAGQGANSLGTLLNGVSALGSAAGGVFGNVVGGVAQLAKLSHEINKIDSDAFLNFTNAGFTDLQSRAMQISLKYMDEKEQMGLLLTMSNIEKTTQEYNNLKAYHDNIIAEYDKIIAEKDLLIAQEGEVNALAKVHQAEQERIKAVTQMQQAENQFFAAHGFKVGQPIYESIRDAIVSGKGADYPIDAVTSTISSYQGKVSLAQYSAQSAASWNSRPSNAVEWSAWIARGSSNILKNLISKVKSGSELRNSLAAVRNKEAEQEFEELYDNAKSELYTNYRHYRSEYRRIRYSAASDSEIAKAKQKMLEAKKEYNEFSREMFSDVLVKQFTDQVKNVNLSE